MVFKNGQCVFSGSSSDPVTSLDCPHILLNKSEFEISDEGRLVILSSKYVYDPELYELLKDSNQVAVCSNFTQNYTSSELEYNFDDVQAILSVIGITLSIIGCVLTICVYLSFKSLRNIPGKIVISLCISLILAYLTMLIGPAMRENFAGCKSFAIMMHYFFLVAFFWMNVMAIDVWYTFAYHQAGGSSERSTRFRFYVLYVFIMASIPVILSTILNETEIADDFSPHYGEGICWFTRRNALLVFFGLPSLLVLIANVILFLIAANTIYSAQKNSVRLLGKEDKSMLSIYVRLTIVMGVAYLFGFLVPLYNHPAILYIFIILNTLQGLFIFVSFVCTRKVLGLIRERANNWSQSRSDGSYSGSRSTTKSSAVSFRPTTGKF
ncbi:hypothetical protein LOTGIDRAFT_108512 [Lottia gigantea]|uniref:G-protein coupled receptors family 2 profile 2 domain-containing protein n=1 Tax=Lottia gigantea TaxID=225164 RepID=V4B5X4_LOTGI|nr:hypothetical protein LOTGIDRAFT_108512 [Lottia gigantea]ESO83924.1 hypothetical protein LOTGIDRAFT_108512 [Lottia gigantea]